MVYITLFAQNDLPNMVKFWLRSRTLFNIYEMEYKRICKQKHSLVKLIFLDYSCIFIVHLITVKYFIIII